MDVAKLASRVSKLAIDNSPVILTAVGVIGTISAAVLTGKASFKANDILHDEQHRLNMHEKSHELTTQEKVKLVWKEYIPPVAVAALTVTAILGANRINTSRAAALAAAYKLSEKQITEYKDKVIERLTPAKEKAMRDEIAQEKVTANPPSNQPIVVSGTDVLCYEAYTDRYFKGSVNAIEKARNDINLALIDNTYATLGDFYEKLGLGMTSIANEVGWNLDCPLEIDISATVANDGQPVIVVTYKKLPIPIREYSFQPE